MATLLRGGCDQFHEPLEQAGALGQTRRAKGQPGRFSYFCEYANGAIRDSTRPVSTLV